MVQILLLLILSGYDIQRESIRLGTAPDRLSSRKLGVLNMTSELEMASAGNAAGLGARAAVIAGGFALAMLTAVVQPAYASFVDYSIRGTPTINQTATQTEFIIVNSGDKAALGSNDINGTKLGDIANLHIDRLDDVSRFAAGSGPAVAPYLNFWITDGTHFAVVANEPSNPGFQTLYNNGYDLSFADLSDKVAKIYENSDTSWLPNGGVGLTFADLADYVIMAPSNAFLLPGLSVVGSGAPRDASNNAYGVNWVFGDTLSNYVSGDPGYIVANASVTANAVPEPMTMALFGAGLLGLGAMRRRRAA
jgi:hypothetical protein